MRRDAGTGRVGTRRAEEPQPGLLTLVGMCLRDPRVLTAVGEDGLEGRRMVGQLVAAYALLTYVQAVVSQSMMLGFGLDALAGGLVTLLSGVAGLFVLAVAFWAVAGMVKSKARFLGLLTGLAFVQIMAAVALLLIALVAGLSLLLGASAETAVMFLGIAYFVVAVTYLVFYAMGAFDVGCFGSFALAIVGAVAADALQHLVTGGLRTMTGG